MTDVENTNFISVVVHDDIQARMPNAARVVFYFAAMADSTAPLGSDAQELEKRDRQWSSWSAPIDAVVEMLRFSSGIMTLWKLAIEMHQSGLLAAADYLALYPAATAPTTPGRLDRSLGKLVGRKKSENMSDGKKRTGKKAKKGKSTDRGRRGADGRCWEDFRQDTQQARELHDPSPQTSTVLLEAVVEAGITISSQWSPPWSPPLAMITPALRLEA